jgi:hypothetical protein
MKSTLILFFCLVAQLSIAQCGCYTDSNVSENYLYQRGRISAAYGKLNIPLTHGDEIKPEAGTTIVFKFNETPEVRNSCKKLIYITIFDEKERREILNTQVIDRLETSYKFPLSDRTYTVMLSVSAISTATDDVSLHAAANRDCTKKMAVFVIPTAVKDPFKKQILKPLKN